MTDTTPELLNTPFRDQRTMVYVTTPEDAHRSTEEVEAAWQRWATDHGLTVRARRGDPSRDLHESRQRVFCYVSGGKWIGTCPNCNGGVAGWPFHERGCCLDCGTIYRLEYPDKATINELAELLPQRPEQYQTWHPEIGGLERVREEQEQFAALNVQQPTLLQVDLSKLSDDERRALVDAGLGKALA